jgi:hypothetical protein
LPVAICRFATDQATPVRAAASAPRAAASRLVVVILDRA